MKYWNHLKKILIAAFCSVHFFALLADQPIYLSGTPETNTYLAPNTMPIIEAIRGLKLWAIENEKSFPGNMLHKYRTLTSSTMPLWFFPFGAPRSYFILSVESSEPGKEPIYTTCPAPWKDCLSGHFTQPSSDYMLAEHVLFLSDFGPESAFAHLARYAFFRDPLRRPTSVVQYEWPIFPFFAPHEVGREADRRVIFSYPSIGGAQ